MTLSQATKQYATQCRNELILRHGQDAKPTQPEIMIWWNACVLQYGLSDAEQSGCFPGFYLASRGIQTR